MLYNRCTGIYKFGNNTYPRRIRRRSNLGNIFRGKKCVLWAGKYVKTNISGLLHEVQQNRSTHNLILKEEHFKIGRYSTEFSTQNKTQTFNLDF